MIQNIENPLFKYIRTRINIFISMHICIKLIRICTIFSFFLLACTPRLININEYYII